MLIIKKQRYIDNENKYKNQLIVTLRTPTTVETTIDLTVVGLQYQKNYLI